MKKQTQKPAGWRNFDRLTRQLIQIPKDEVEAQIEAGRRERKAKRRKKK